MIYWTFETYINISISEEMGLLFFVIALRWAEKRAKKKKKIAKSSLTSWKDILIRKIGKLLRDNICLAFNNKRKDGYISFVDP